MDRYKWFFHPFLIFIFSIFALGSSLILYIYWYVEASEGLKAVVERFNLDPDQILAAQTWVVILVLSILVGIILSGMFTIFAYSQKMVQLYRFQRNFINNFTHELKTPVASLRLYLETFKKHELQRDERLKYIDYMLSDVQRLSDNISRILNLARIESKSYTGQFSWMDPMAFIDRFLKKNQHLLTNCRVQVVNGPQTMLLCRINPTLFEILLTNIFTNAIKYNRSETPCVDIDATVRKGKLVLDFKDNGIGFDPRERKKIFRKFYQIDQAEDVTTKGSGIGLYLVQSIAKLHKGRIIASSEGPGRGSVLTLTLPASEMTARQESEIREV